MLTYSEILDQAEKCLPKTNTLAYLTLTSVTKKKKGFTAATPVTQPSMKRILKKQKLAQKLKKKCFHSFQFLLVQSTAKDSVHRHKCVAEVLVFR
jgi:hypothetical protein